MYDGSQHIHSHTHASVESRRPENLYSVNVRTPFNIDSIFKEERNERRKKEEEWKNESNERAFYNYKEIAL